MAKGYTSQHIRRWIERNERFEGRSFGNGLTLRYRASDKVPHWRFRYSLDGKPRTLSLGSYRVLTLAKARKAAKELRARVVLGFDPAEEKRQRLAEHAQREEARKNVVTVSSLCDRYMAERIIDRYKHPQLVRNAMDRFIVPQLGHLALDDVTTDHIRELLEVLNARGAPTVATKTLRLAQKLFDFAIKRQLLAGNNPAAAFDPSDAGGSRPPRTRWLNDDDLRRLFGAMQVARSWAPEHTNTVRLLLILACRKMELIGARIEEFDLDDAIWRLPAERTKTGRAIAIPLPRQAVRNLRQLVHRAGRHSHLLPARKQQLRMLPHIAPDTLNAAIAQYIRPLLPDVDRFTVHDFRRTARTHLEALGTPEHVAERCLNHALRGIVGVYNQYAYLDERRTALQAWADKLQALEEDAIFPAPARSQPGHTS